MRTDPLKILLVFLATVLGTSLLQAKDKEPGETTRSTQPIVNGTEAPAADQPWMAALLIGGDSEASPQQRHFCGGALIAPQWVLTAAHCAAAEERGPVDVWLGSNDLGSGAGELHRVAEFITHPFYDKAALYIDIALLRLETPSTLRPINLPTRALENQFYGQALTLFGWGATGWTGESDCELIQEEVITDPDDFGCLTYVLSAALKPATLMQAPVNLFTQQQCGDRLRAFLKTQGEEVADFEDADDEFTAQLCTWDQAERSSGCFGDSGGPLVGRTGGEDYILGVVSFIIKGDCSAELQINVMTRVAAMTAFIREAMGSSQQLAFEELCPAQPEPTLTYTPAGQNKMQLTISWDDDSRAKGYTLYYSHYPVKGGFVGKLRVPAASPEFAIVLPTGARYLAAVQAHGADCDSEMSSLQAVVVP